MSPDASARIPDGSVVITPTEQYAELREIGKKIDHLSAVMDPAVNELRVDIADVKKDIAGVRSDARGLESKVNGIDKRVYAFGVVAAALGTVGGWVIQLTTGG